MKETKDIFNESYKPLKRFCLEERGRWGGDVEGEGDRGEKWPKQCMHI
jgi:hypothetical protein